MRQSRSEMAQPKWRVRTVPVNAEQLSEEIGRERDPEDLDRMRMRP
jgi:hypothetical protein